MINKKFVFVNLANPLENGATYIEEGIVYITASDCRVDFKCPCGCGDIITLSTIPDTHPAWKVEGHSIIPSINRTIGCKSHFCITNGISVPA